MNTLRVAHNRRAPLLQVVGRSAALVDNYGNSLIDYSNEGIPPGKAGKYFRLGTPGIWLDPSSPGVRRYFLETIRDLVTTYPELDGVHLDMVRMPLGQRLVAGKGPFGGLRYGYSSASLARFRKEAQRQTAQGTGESNPKGSELVDDSVWEEWKRTQITLLVFEVRELLNTLAPHMELSAAVIAWPERAHSLAFQDWERWLQGRIMNSVLPMSYTRDRKVLRRHSKHANKVASFGRVIMGLGAWLMVDNLSLMKQQVELALGEGSDGIALFSYSNLQSAQGERLVKMVGESLRAAAKQPREN